jgi:hypothetical protein
VKSIVSVSSFAVPTKLSIADTLPFTYTGVDPGTYESDKRSIIAAGASNSPITANSSPTLTAENPFAMSTAFWSIKNMVCLDIGIRWPATTTKPFAASID